MTSDRQSSPARGIGTGRLTAEVGRRTRRILYRDHTGEALVSEMALLVQLDQAHLLMLYEHGLVGADTARQLLRSIRQLEACGFAPLLDRDMPRGVYLMYEDYLRQESGADVAGVLHTARSRNDIKATITSLRLRQWVTSFAQEAARLEAILLNRARHGQEAVMPVYTHFQAALPATYGWYLAGVTLAMAREVDAVLTHAEALTTCPLGAGAAAGSSLPVNPYRTASLLGFARPATHALDAVASQDGMLRMLAAAAGLTVCLSRFATDLQLWSTAEFGLVRFPDRLVGGSSAMPQKRNAFILEHVRAKAAQAIGAWTASATSTTGTPFTNSIEVGTEALARAWPGFLAVDDAMALSQVLVSGARPCPARMRERVVEGYVAATAVADRLVRQGMPFREAHRTVGDAVRRAVVAGSTDLAQFLPADRHDGVSGTTPVDLSEVGMAELVQDQRYGGGPGEFDEPFAYAVDSWRRHMRWHEQWRDAAAAAKRELATAVGRVLSGGG